MRSMTYKHIGTSLHAGCSKALCEELAKRGYTTVDAVVPLVYFDSKAAAAALQSLFPNIQRLLSAEEPQAH